MSEKKNNIIRIIKWLGIAYLITILLIAIYAGVLTFTNVPESTIPMCVIIISMLSILLASSLSVRKIKERGLANGAMIGFSYILVLYLLSSIFVTGFSLNTYSIWMIILCGVIGCIGGIIGVNL